MKAHTYFFILCTLLIATGNTRAEEVNHSERCIYVSPQGDDSANGSEEAPVRTFEAAQRLARSARKPSSVWFQDGIYYLPRTIVLDSRDNHTSYHALHPRKAIISGGDRLSLKWKKGKGGIYWARVEKDLVIDQLFVNGQRKRMARYPNVSDEQDANVFDRWRLNDSGNDGEQDALDKARIARWKDPAGGYVHAMHEYLWGDMHWLIKGKEAGELVLEGGWQNNRPSKMHPKFRMVENIREELDEPGEWYYDRESNRLYYMPDGDDNLDEAVVEVVSLDCLLALKGEKDNAVRDVTIEGFTFRHAARTFMQNKERLLRSDWTTFRGGAVLFQNAEDCTLSDCDFDQVGGNAVFVNLYNRDLRIAGCYIHDAGANGIAFVGDTASVRHPMFDYFQKASEVTDHERGPRTDNYPAHCLVEDCLITRTGRTEKQTAGIQISMSFGIHVNHCSVYGVPRAGINISEGTFGGHVIENCDVFDTVLETGDHGSFNSWGRDRYWSPSVAETSQLIASHPGWESLDMLARNVIRHSRWKCDHGWDIDLDDGSSNYLICDNLLLGGGLKLREGFNRKVVNNIILNNSLHLHAWYRNSRDVIMHNILSRAHAPAVMTSVMKDDEKWGTCIDENFFDAPREEAYKFIVNGCDSCSLYGNPQFVNPRNGDYRVEKTSPVLALGFHNFSMDDFGVVSDRLKAIARQPIISAPKAQVGEGQSESQTIGGVKWTLVTGNTLSAYGMDLKSRGFSVSYEGENPLAQYGIRKGDLLLKINGRDLKDFSILKAELQAGIQTVELVREQKKMVLPQ